MGFLFKKKQVITDDTLRVGIMGAGGIAAKMAETLAGMGSEAVAYAVASRSLEKAEYFAKKHGIKQAYGSYEELAKDNNVDLIYIATPHSEHYKNAMLCIENHKPVLVEKAFTANASQAAALIKAAENAGVFLTEAIWTRYMPSATLIKEKLNSGIIGEIEKMEAEFSIPISDKERMRDPALCGGALMDLGMYALTTASIYFGDDLWSVEATCEKFETGVDATDEISYHYADGKEAKLRCSMINGPKNEAIVYGTKGCVKWTSLNNPSDIVFMNKDGQVIEELKLPKQITGYEYEVLACKRALMERMLECDEMPHSETMEIMIQMDELRARWGIKFPFEE